MGGKLYLHDIVGPFEARSNLDHLHDACIATRKLRDDADRFWESGSDQHSRWVRACDELRDILNTVPSRKASCEKAEDALSSVIHAFCHSEYRMVELLSTPEHEVDIEPTLQWLQVVFRAAIYGTLRTWIPHAQVSPPIVKIEIDLATGITSECVEYTPMRIPHRYRRYK